MKDNWNQGKYLNIAGTVGSTALDVASVIPAFNITNRAIDFGLARAGNNAARGRVIARTMGKPNMNNYIAEEIKPLSRFLLGDVEIDNPQLNYHLSARTKIKNWLNDGVPRTDTERYWLNEARNGRHVPISLRAGILPGFPQQPNRTMFSKGSLWYGINPEQYPELFVTAKDLPFGNSQGGFVDTNNMDMLYHAVGKRRIIKNPAFKDQALNFNETFTPENTTAYIFEPGYGYRKVSTDNPHVFLGHFQRPSKLTEAERLGIPKGERFVRPFRVASYPGYLLKSLMKGSPLERQLSKNGTISINQLNAHFNKASQVERDVVNKVLTEKFNGLRIVDYNLLKKAVLDELITYKIKPLYEYSTYGMDRLGFQVKREPDGAGGILEYTPGINTKTFTFESSRIPYGNTKHYGGNPIGHSRTYNLPEDPHTLYVMESQSDWAQNYGKTPKFKISENGRTNVIFDEETVSWKPVENGTGELYDEIKNDPGVMNYINNYFIGNASGIQSDYLAKNYLQRQLQENLRYAAENGLTKMRYPTLETAAKIEGYAKQNLYRNPEGKIVTSKDALQHSDPNIIGDLREDLAELASNLRQQGIQPSTNQLWIRMNSQLKELESPKLKEGFLNIGLDYPTEHQTILKKYADFPKLFNKLYKGQEVRTVTDTKGNTWFEVDVPKNYLHSEWLFKQGGILNTKSQTD